jgi:4-hydroxybenzoate polyprenyltransferase
MTNTTVEFRERMSSDRKSSENDSYDPLKYIVNPLTAPGPILENCAICAVSIFANLFYCLYKDFKTVFNNDESVISRSKAGGRIILAALTATALAVAPLPIVAVAVIATVVALAYSIFYAFSDKKQADKQEEQTVSRFGTSK